MAGYTCIAYVISLYLRAMYATFKPQAPERRCAMSSMTEPLDTSTLLGRIRSCLQAVYGDRLRGVVLYGSEARGEETPDSDVDILVLLAGPVALGRDLQTIIEALYPLQLAMDRVLEAFPVDEADYLRGEYAWYRNVQKEGIQL
jgi:predicted nucleotidyltransferase